MSRLWIFRWPLDAIQFVTSYPTPVPRDSIFTKIETKEQIYANKLSVNQNRSGQ